SQATWLGSYAKAGLVCRPDGLAVLLTADTLRPTTANFFCGLRAMPAEPDQPVTELLRAAQAGDADAAERLLAGRDEHPPQLGRARLARVPPGQTLQPTALVHEAYLRLTDKSDVSWESRQHFFFAAARAMRDILVEQARRKAR